MLFEFLLRDLNGIIVRNTISVGFALKWSSKLMYNGEKIEITLTIYSITTFYMQNDYRDILCKKSFLKNRKLLSYLFGIPI